MEKTRWLFESDLFGDFADCFIFSELSNWELTNEWIGEISERLYMNI